MRGRKLRSGSLVALLGALILVLGTAPTFGQTEEGKKRGDIYTVAPERGTFDYPHKARSVRIRFRKPLVTDDESKPISITVKDSCDRPLSNKVTVVGENDNPPTDDDNGWFDQAKVQLDRRNKNPKGWYYVTAEYWLEADEEENSDDPDNDDPPPAEARTYSYRFKVHGGPNCDGKSGDDGNHPPGHGGGNGDKKRFWGSTSGNDHDHTDGHVGSPNLRSATGSTSPTHSGHTPSTDFTPYTSPTIPSSDTDHDEHSSTSTTPFGEDDFGDPFGESTGNSPLSDPTDPSLYESDAGQIPEEAADQQTLRAAPVDDLGPESSTLVVALAAALLLGVGGGLFLRRTDPAPVRPRS